MSSRERAARALKAVEAGKAAFLAGQPITANPYRQPTGKPVSLGGCARHGDWSVWGFWNLGYNDAKNTKPIKETPCPAPAPS